MKNSHATAQTPDDLLTELKSLVTEAETMMSDSHSEHSTETFAKLRDRFGAAQARLAEIYEGAKQQVSAGAKYTDTTIRENPYQAMAVAAGIGLLVGVLVGRRSK